MKFSITVAMSGLVVCFLVTAAMLVMAAPKKESLISSENALPEVASLEESHAEKALLEESHYEASSDRSQESQDPLRSRHHKNKGHKKCKKKAHKKNHSKPKTKSVFKKDALGPIHSGGGTVKARLEPLSKMSSLNSKFWAYKHLPNRTVEPDWYKYSDCIYGSRKLKRRYPSVPGDKCYLYDFDSRMDQWWNFWPEIRGDLEYAFDFVMWDEYELYHETNSLWYLMLYLKTLLLHIEDPNNVATRPKLEPDTRRNGNESLRRAPDIKEPEQFPDESPEEDSLHELLTEYTNKLQQLDSMVASF